MLSEVRLAVPNDEAPMMIFLQEMHEENGLAPFCEDKVRAVLQRGLMRDHALIGIIRGDKGIEASLGIFIGGFWYSDNTHLEDLWNYVREDHRRTPTGTDSHAKKLLNFAKWAAEQLNKPLFMGVLSTERTAAKARLYQRSFGVPIGAMFLINSTPPSPAVAVG